MTTSTRISIRVASCIIALTAFLALGGCTTILRPATVEKRPLTYIGQVSFGPPQVRGSRVVVPLTFDGGGWGRDSAIDFYRVQSRFSGRSIEMTVLTALAGRDPAPKELRLGRVSPGQYSVAYRDPIFCNRKIEFFHYLGISNDAEGLGTVAGEVGRRCMAGV